MFSSNFVVLTFCILSIFILVPNVSAAACESPKYSANGYSTQDGFFHYKTSYIIEFAIQCSNNYKDAPFYALVGEKTLQLAVSEETNKYQVSWQLEHADSGAQTFDIRVYDEDKFAEHKKAEESGSSSVQPLFTVQHYHGGTSHKTWISSESVFLLLGVVALYFTMNLRQLLAKRD
ncbi:hypothetical protein niasHT_030867 [Heterodera trifolii]|uniref:Translocon-associated protein subunit delta n=1 Tax=Heterodera trifolii TaxID=157864 RepID=A0ABD2HUD4_9BILA